MTRIFSPRKIWLLAVLVVLFLGNGTALSAQRNKNKGGGGGEPKILKNLPSFFVSDAFLSPKLKNIYRKDASRLALRLLSKEQLITHQDVVIPEILVQAVYNALIAVRVSDNPCMDSIGRLLNIRTFPIPNVNQITLIFDHDAEWAKPLKMRADTTGSPTINGLMRQYRLTISRLAHLDDERSGLVLIAKDPLNIPALSRKFFMEEAIGCVEEMQTFGDGDDIDIALDEQGWLITYSCRFGQCLNKCNKHHDWAFRVDRSGNVKFLGSTGDPIPPWRFKPPADPKKKVVGEPDQLKDPKTGTPYYNNANVGPIVQENEDPNKGKK